MPFPREVVAALGPQALLTGLLPAEALGIRWVPPTATVQVLIPASVRRAPRPGVQVRRTSAFAALAADAWTWNGVAVAPPARVVLDAALTLDRLRDVRGVVLAAVADGLASTAELRQLLDREPRNGTALVRRALRDAATGAASPPEAELADGLRGCRLPFVVNAELRLHGRPLGFPDGYFVGLGAGWELDSRTHHEEADALEATLHRHTVFGAAGIALAHVTPRQLRRDPAGVVAAVLSVARSRQQLPAHLREPPGLEVLPRGPVLR